MGHHQISVLSRGPIDWDCSYGTVAFPSLIILRRFQRAAVEDWVCLHFSDLLKYDKYVT